MRSIPLYQVDAFTSRRFTGNPAAVCPLEEWLDDATLQAIAAENNLSETAYFVPEGDGYRLRWFTPAVEVDLCGHATLASAFVLMTILDPARTSVSFRTLSGMLRVERDGDRYTLDFPARPPQPVPEHPGLRGALGGSPQTVLAARDYLVVYGSQEEVEALRPDMAALSGIDRFAVIVTAPGSGDVDFVSRFFAPAQGVPEDPVTGSAHCTLTPYWAERLGKPSLRARQVSARGGDLWCELAGERVRMSGQAVLVLEGTLFV